MGIFKKDKKFDPKKPVPTKPLNEGKTLWCRKHGSTKVACGCPS